MLVPDNSSYTSHCVICNSGSDGCNNAFTPSQYRLSKVLNEVVPTATIVLSKLVIMFSIAIVLTSIHSACISCCCMVAAFTGLNVPAPTCRVTNPLLIFFSSRLLKISCVKCKPAVGAATEPFCKA